MKFIPTLSLLLVGGLAGASASFADPAVQTTVVTTITNPTPVAVVARDGFTEKSALVWVTENGVSKVMLNNMKLSNGIEIRTDGVIIVPGVTKKTLHAGDWLAFDGTLTRADSGKVEYLRPER